MELWVRSQLKEFLIKVNDLRIMQLTENGYEIGEKTDDWFIVANDEPCVGKYKTKERALEVLDEINEFLQLKLCATLGTFEEVFKGYSEKQLKFILKQMAVYQMPEK